MPDPTPSSESNEARLQRHIDREEFIGQLSVRLSALSDPEAMIRLATESTARKLNANRGYFAEVGEKPTQMIIPYDWHRPGEASAAGTYETRAYGSPLWWEKLARGALLIPDIAEHPATRDYAAGYHHFNTQACVAVPFTRDGQWVVTLVISDSRPREWTADEALLLEGVVSRFWPAIERARSNAAFQRQAERLNLAIAAAELGDWSWDAATDEMTLSPRTCEIFGLSASGTVIRRSQMRTMLHPDDSDRAESANLEAIANRIDYDIEYRLHHPRRGWRWIATRGRCLYKPDGALVGMIGVLQDVTARKEIETDRRQGEERLRERTRTLEILNAVSSALVAEHDPQRIIEAVVKAGREITSAAEAHFDPRFPGAGVLRAPPGAHRGNGAREAPRSYLAAPVVARSGEVLGGLVFVHPDANRFDDECERTVVGLAAEAAIAVDNANVYRTLEQRVLERTTSLRDVITQMEEFSYSVSHDLRAPLRAMNGYAQALLDDYGDRLDATARGYLDRIQRSSQRMEKLTYDLLTYSRIARSDLRMAPVNLDKLVADIVHQYVELQAPRSQIAIAGPLGDASGHESSLAQAAANLLTNAVKFVPAGVTPRVRVWSDRQQERVRLWIEDNGIGIKPEHHSRLFQVFERLPTDARYEGTGIGLAIVRKAMEKMGGTCGVESDGRSGSRFWLELPKA
ncbi:MAG TPA: ATP-binding protein [Opitutaceae bacterium]|jgi:PAS domain S-box-containing protein